MKLTKAQRKTMQTQAVQAAYDTLLNIYRYASLPQDGERRVSIALDKLGAAFPNDEVNS